MTDVVGLAPQIQVIARRYGQARDFLFLGRGNNYPIALEGALKLKEISYIHAEGYASGEMKHGPIALIDEAMPVVVIAPKGPGYDKVMSNLAEVKARDGEAYGSGGEAITWTKRRRLMAAAGEFLARHAHGERACRFDVVSIRLGPDGPVAEVYANAFGIR